MQHTLFYVPVHKRKLQNNDTKKFLPRFRRHSSCWVVAARLHQAFSRDGNVRNWSVFIIMFSVSRRPKYSSLSMSPSFVIVCSGAMLMAVQS